ncbi:MAG: zinc-binding dehydrogenase [Phycisphaerales bacterium]|nr:MAG: zinc-binding dehydrogenase [Phycisphaerales bacterium]
MKALVLNEIKRPLDFEDRPGPVGEEGEVIVRLRAAALNRRDYWITQGLYPAIRCPVILGSDGAGIVAASSGGADSSWQGREVIINPGYGWGDKSTVQGPDFRILGMPDDGTFAEEIAVPTTQLYPKPDHLGWEEAAALPLAGLTAYRALFSQGKLQKGEKVLITGIGGGVASIAMQLATAAGAAVFVTSSSQVKIDRAVSMGAAAGFDYTESEWAESLTSQHGSIDLIIDGAGGTGYSALIDVASAGGRIVNYGATAGAPDTIELRKVFWKQLHLVGSTMGSGEDFEAMLEMVNQFRIKPVIDHVFPLSKGNEALQRMETSPQFGKLVLRTT